jgi:hypothetical protein
MSMMMMIIIIMMMIIMMMFTSLNYNERNPYGSIWTSQNGMRANEYQPEPY